MAEDKLWALGESKVFAVIAIDDGSLDPLKIMYGASSEEELTEMMKLRGFTSAQCQRVTREMASRLVGGGMFATTAAAAIHGHYRQKSRSRTGVRTEPMPSYLFGKGISLRQDNAAPQ